MTVFSWRLCAIKYARVFPKDLKYYISVLCLRQNISAEKYVIEMLEEPRCLFLISKSHSLENALF